MLDKPLFALSSSHEAQINPHRLLNSHVADIHDKFFLKHLAQGPPLNQPWGFAAAPNNFGPLSNTLLVSNNTNSGTINAFNAITGQFVGTIKDSTGKAIQIDQLWGIDFGDGLGNNGPKDRLFFTAGPDNNFAGTLGSIVFK